MIGVLIINGEIWAQASTEGRLYEETRGEHHVKVGVTLPQANGRLGL